MAEDKKLNCRDCNQEFVFSAGEQDFFSQRGLNSPVRCKECRAKKKRERDQGGNDRR